MSVPQDVPAELQILQEVVIPPPGVQLNIPPAPAPAPATASNAVAGVSSGRPIWSNRGIIDSLTYVHEPVKKRVKKRSHTSLMSIGKNINNDQDDDDEDFNDGDSSDSSEENEFVCNNIWLLLTGEDWIPNQVDITNHHVHDRCIRFTPSILALAPHLFTLAFLLITPSQPFHSLDDKIL